MHVFVSCVSVCVHDTTVCFMQCTSLPLSTHGIPTIQRQVIYVDFEVAIPKKMRQGGDMNFGVFGPTYFLFLCFCKCVTQYSYYDVVKNAVFGSADRNDISTSATADLPHQIGVQV